MAGQPHPAQTAERTGTRRGVLLAAALLTVALGLSIRTVGTGAWTGPAGDVLYAVLVYLLVAVLVPARPRLQVAGAALALCALIEVLQLTGLPAELARSWPPVRLVLGTTFAWVDLVAYAGGSALAWAVDRAVAGRATGSAGAAVRCSRRGGERRRRPRAAAGGARGT